MKMKKIMRNKKTTMLLMMMLMMPLTTTMTSMNIMMPVPSGFLINRYLLFLLRVPYPSLYTPWRPPSCLQSLKVFRHLILSPPFHELYSSRAEGATADLGAVLHFQYLVRSILPALAAHLDILGLNGEVLLVPWVLSAFSVALPPKAMPRFFDQLLLFGGSFFFQAGLALLSYHSPELLGSSYERCVGLLLRPIDADLFDDEKFFRCVAFHERTLFAAGRPAGDRMPPLRRKAVVRPADAPHGSHAKPL
eukprot:GHVT01056590.1.p1 GENE.GHVT01056590.1~~GHVT01056590.1.p1  ORF type:complete len:271 (+),score=45.81 GHVT01056590.1:67-813(+)